MREHPGKTAKDFRRLSTEDLMAWRAPKNQAHLAAERQAWERHPGQEWPEHLCGLSDAEYDQRIRDAADDREDEQSSQRGQQLANCGWKSRHDNQPPNPGMN